MKLPIQRRLVLARHLFVIDLHPEFFQPLDTVANFLRRLRQLGARPLDIRGVLPDLIQSGKFPPPWPHF